MDKYSVLVFIIIYAVALSVTNAVFYLSTTDSLMGVDTSTFSNIDHNNLDAWSLVWVILPAFFGIVTIPVPLIIYIFIAVPYLILLLYFVYLNIPKVAGSGSPQP